MQDRWLHIRQPKGFSPEMFDAFCASVEIFVAHAQAILRVYRRLPNRAEHPEVSLSFHQPELSADGTVASFRISGESTLGTRAEIEFELEYILWRFFPMEFMEGLEVGHTENGAKWWSAPSHTITFVHADPEHRRRVLRTAG